jgi:hypothetical protein
MICRKGERLLFSPSRALSSSACTGLSCTRRHT